MSKCFLVIFTSISYLYISQSKLTLPSCDDKEWCNIDMPKESLFNFPPPTDTLRWRNAQISAALGNQILLKKVNHIFKHPYDMLDGDTQFKNLHFIADFFADEKSMLSSITGGYISASNEKRSKKVDNTTYLFDPYQSKYAHRAPIVMIGYLKFAAGPYKGKVLGYESIQRRTFLKEFMHVEKYIKHPTIFIAGTCIYSTK